MNPVSDAQLVLRARGGDQNAFEQLLHRHADIIGNVCQSIYSLPGADEHDLQQEARIAFLDAVRRYEPNRIASFRTFAGRVIENHLADALKTATRKKRRVLTESKRFNEQCADDLELGDVIPSLEPSPHERIVGRERFEAFVNVVCGCSTTERRVVARVLNGMTMDQAGQDLGHNQQKTADNAIQRVRHKLASMIAA